jgi:thioredoxin-dependent peroxiredoxin
MTAAVSAGATMVTAMTTRLAAGDPAPAFSLPDADGNEVSLADYAGRRVIVYFYPAAMTPGCTTQAVDFTAAMHGFNDAGIAVLGISPDPQPKLAQFRAQQSVSFPLLSDEDRTVLGAYGAYGEKLLYGKLIEGVIRSTFLVDVDDDGKATISTAQYNVKAAGHVDRLRRELHV